MTQGQASRMQTRYRVTEQTLVIDLGGKRRVLSSAPQGGGFTAASSILNHQVESNPVSNTHPRAHDDPVRALRRLAVRLGVQQKTVGLMTAVPMKQLVTARVSSGSLWVECFATVGVTNAVKAGERPETDIRRGQAAGLGTINLIVVTNVCLSSAAMVGAVQVVTESKTGVLRDHAVPSWTGLPGATGTGTDAVVIACRLRGQGPWQAYSGTHTMIGALIGQAVTQCVARGLAKAKQWQKRHA
ncbi:adenosylcobinamide amidohydrolase [Nitrospira lenta]|uniref:Putative Adenosylcobinamide amidohydrolase n=1 Tax=Nitrospira lenta TaxID=1436998 RepID=A0A330L9B6_9BACT|nr:adenosylcobinamide amidohydrolase [Nitrospira lenta]SPP66468.1 putative Adenosylcobinamide amidohydrolase [Nitrospira lenta]